MISPRFKVISPTGEYIASFKHPAHAAHFIRATFPGSRAHIRDGSTTGPVVYRESTDGLETSARAHDLIWQRIQEHGDQQYDKRYGAGAAAKLRDERPALVEMVIDG